MEGDRSLRFGDFSLDLAKEQLFCSGEVVALTPKAFVVLRRLVDDGGQLVSKEQLLQAGWPKTHVSHGVLKVIILEIRRALGDDPAAPSFITSAAFCRARASVVEGAQVALPAPVTARVA